MRINFEVDLAVWRWSWNQWKAVGRNSLSYVAGVATGMGVCYVMLDVELSDVSSSLETLEKIATRLVAIVGILVPIYTIMKSAGASSPDSQIKSVTEHVANGATPQQRHDVISAVANMPQREEVLAEIVKMPEVKAIVADERVAMATSSDKVVPPVMAEIAKAMKS